MEKIKKFKDYKKDKKEETIKLYGLPNEHLIEVSKDEFKFLNDEDFNIVWNDYDETTNDWYFEDSIKVGHYMYDDDDEEEIKQYLELFRELKNREAVDNAVKYNIT